MARRFTDTEKWKDEWYGSLSNDNRIIWQYLLDNCTQAGIFKKDWRLLRFQCNTTITEEDFLKVFGQRVIDCGNYFFIPKFLKYQNQRGLNSNKPAIISIREELERNNLIPIVHQSLGNDFLIIKGIGKGKGEGIGEGKGIGQGKGKPEEPAGTGAGLTEADFRKLNISSAEVHQLIEDQCKFFSVSTDPMSTKYTAVVMFVEMLIHRNQYDRLRSSFGSYMAYKTLSQEPIHGIVKWMGTKEEFFNDGEWTTTDWSMKADNLRKIGKVRQNGPNGFTAIPLAKLKGG